MQVHLLISGYVQRVGFRQFVKKNAMRLGLTGWVRNIPDNKVEAVIQSSANSDQEGREKIEEMIKLCQKGPFLSEVEDVKVDWQETKESFSSFDILL